MSYDTVKVSVSTGVEQFINNNEQIIIYPNPAKDKLTVSSNRFTVNTIEIMDVLARTQMVRQAHLDGVVSHAEERSISVDVSVLTSGIYFIKATDIKGNIIKAKFVKE